MEEAGDQSAEPVNLWNLDLALMEQEDDLLDQEDDLLAGDEPPGLDLLNLEREVDLMWGPELDWLDMEQDVLIQVQDLLNQKQDLLDKKQDLLNQKQD